MKKKRFLCFLLCLSLTLTLLPPATARAADTVGLFNYHNIGTFDPSMLIGFGGRQWNMIGLDGAAIGYDPVYRPNPDDIYSLTLFSTSSFGTTPFNGSMNNTYGGSTLQTALNGLLADPGFSPREKALLIPRALSDAGITAQDQLFWVPSKGELEKGYPGITALLPRSGWVAGWWLRTPDTASGDPVVYAVQPGGTILARFPTTSLNIRPAILVNTRNVKFISDAVGGKNVVPGVFTKTTRPAGAFKLTFLDTDTNNLSLSVPSQPVTRLQGAWVSIPYSGARTAANKYVSCAIRGPGDEYAKTMLYYAKVSQSGSGAAVLRIPADLAAGDYSLSFFNEEIGGDNESDFISAPQDIPLTVKSPGAYTPSGDASLSDLKVNGVTVGGFASNTVEYTVELPAGTPIGAHTRISATAADTLNPVSIVQTSSLPGDATVTVTAENDTQRTYTVHFAVASGPAITTASLPAGTKGAAYQALLAATGTAPITWSITSGSLPGGLSLSGNAITGTPAAAGTFSFTVRAENIAGAATRSLSITVANPPPAMYTVTFNSQGGSGVASQSIPSDGCASRPADPTRTGYAFSGWYREATCTAAWNFNSDTVTANITLYAKWTVIRYAITAMANNSGYGSVSGGGSIAYGAAATFRATPKAGYRFVRWLEGATVASANWEYTFTVTGNRTLKAEFAKIGTPGYPKAVSASYNSIRITWAAVAGANTYEIYRATSRTGTYARVGTAASAGYTNGGLTTNKTYYYKVRARCVAGGTATVGLYSAVVSARPVPAAPAGLKAARASSRSVKLTWKAVSGATKYEVFRVSPSGAIITRLGTTARLSYLKTGLTHGRTYYFRVRAYHLEGTKKVYGSYSGVVGCRP